MFVKPIPYVTDHPISRTVMAAVAQGLGREPRLAASLSWTPEPAIAYGILRGCQDIFRRCDQAQVDWWHLDLGYWSRGHFDGYYRLSKNGCQRPIVGGRDEPRIPLPELAAWRPGLGPIVVCPPTLLVSIYHPTIGLGGAAHEWEDSVCQALDSLTDRPVVVRRKEDAAASNEPFPEDPYCVVTFNSNMAFDALVRGTPAITTMPGLLAEAGPRLTDIDQPERLRAIDRGWLFTKLSWAQFTLEEFRKGVPWNTI